MENHYNCIYMYINKINGKRYIGKAKDFNKRHKYHLKSKKQLIDKKIKEYGIENFDIKILAENIPNERIGEYEQFFIKRYKTLAKNGNGYNIAKGGEGGNTFEGKTEGEINEKNIKISKANKGKKRTDEHKQKLREFKSISVIQYDKDMNLIKIFNSSYEATNETGINPNSICSCCKFWEMNCDNDKWNKIYKNRPLKTAGGFIWRYKKDMNNNYDYEKIMNNNVRSNSRLIKRLDKDGNLIDVKYNFEYVKMGFDKGNISACCRGKHKTYKGFVWRYADEIE